MEGEWFAWHALNQHQIGTLYYSIKQKKKNKKETIESIEIVDSAGKKAINAIGTVP